MRADSVLLAVVIEVLHLDTASSHRPMSRIARWTLAGLHLTACAATAAAAAAQQPGSFVAGAGLGGTYYCIVSRCNTGTVLGGTAGYVLSAALIVEAGARWHFCFDCDRFAIGDAGLQLRAGRGAVLPFLGAGIGVAADPEFMGTKAGVYGGAGAWLQRDGPWRLRVEVRGRTVGRGDAMGEATLMLARSVRGPPS